MDPSIMQQRRETYIHDERHEEILIERFNHLKQLPMAIRMGRSEEILSLLQEGFWSIETVDRLYTPGEDRSAALHNQLISLNAIFMMIAIESGANPLCIHAVSRHYDVMIDRIHTSEQKNTLVRNMTEDYCDFSIYNGDHTYSATIQKAVWYITADPSVKLDLKDLAHKLGMSASALSRKFHTETGRTITQYHTAFRIRYARRLLRERNSTVTEVAQQVGFHDASYFSKVFVKYVGQTPSVYRQQAIDND